MKVFFVGAHPDDIEIGGAGLVRRLHDDGHDVRFLILTNDPHEAEARHDEAIDSAGCLGVSASSVMFAGFTDGALRTNRSSVSRVRQLMADSKFSPDVVVTHTSADSHNDHSEANRLIRAVFRGKVLLFFSIHLSSELMRFSPRFFCLLTEELEKTKDRALAYHPSQAARIHKNSLPSYESSWSNMAGLERAEAFEIDFQVGASTTDLNEILSYNDSPFHRLWVPLLGNQPLVLLYENFDGSYPHTSHESIGRDILREAFAIKWFPSSPLLERYSNSLDSVSLFQANHTLLAGGPVANVVTRNYFNRLGGIDWIVDYELPGREQVFLVRKSTGRRLEAQFRGVKLKNDLAVLTIAGNPYTNGKRIISCAGVHSEGTRGLLQFLAAPESTDWLMHSILGNARSETLQIPVRVAVDDFRVLPLETP